MVANDRCEICVTLQRLNRVILTRHPATERDTLHKLLCRTADKIEAFVEEWEANRALVVPPSAGEYPWEAGRGQSLQSVLGVSLD